jgi:phosphatidylserine/phosphatidylglycerophosphate/cardiolipin synthase-like enzyme
MKRTGGTALRTFQTGGSSSASSLHAKTFSADRSTVFIGSFNFDPRSARFNTELGFVIECPALAARIADPTYESGKAVQTSGATSDPGGEPIGGGCCPVPRASGAVP